MYSLLHSTPLILLSSSHSLETCDAILTSPWHPDPNHALSGPHTHTTSLSLVYLCISYPIFTSSTLFVTQHVISVSTSPLYRPLFSPSLHPPIILNLISAFSHPISMIDDITSSKPISSVRHILSSSSHTTHSSFVISLSRFLKETSPPSWRSAWHPDPTMHSQVPTLTPHLCQ